MAMSAADLAGKDLNLIPAGMPPRGWTGLFSGPELHTTGLAIFCVLAPIACFAVSCRLISSWQTRGSANGGIGLADYCSVGALVLSIAQEIVVVTLGDYARHSWDVSLAMMLKESFYKRMFVQTLLAWPAIILAKLAILLLYLRLFQIRPAMRYAIYAGVIWTILTYLPNMFIFAYFCTAHPGEPWDFNVGLRCGDKKSLKWLVVSACMSVLLDLYILALPIAVVLKLNMSGRKRFGVLLIFFAAFIACICATLTLVYRILLVHTTDNLWLTSQLWICNLTENFIAIIVGALPGMSSWFKSNTAPTAFFSKLLSTFTSTFSTSKSYSSKPSNSKNSNGSFRLKEYHSYDNESQRSLHRNEFAPAGPGNNIQDKTLHEVNHIQI